jgi:hypothetical protein
MGLATARGFKVGVLFPEFEQQFNLPAQAQHHEGLVKGQASRREIGRHEGSSSEGESSLADRFAFAFGGTAQTGLPLADHRLGHALRQQTAAQAVRG